MTTLDAGETRDRDRGAWLFLLPNGLGFLAFVFLPVVASLALAFQAWDLVTPSRFVGIENFSRLLGDAHFWKYLWNTLVLMSAIPLTMALSLGLALILNTSLPGRTLYRTVLFLPSIAAGIAIYIAWKQFFNKDFGLLGPYLPSLPVWVVASAEALGILLLLSLVTFLAIRVLLDLAGRTHPLRLLPFLLGGVTVWGLLLLNALLIAKGSLTAGLPGAEWIAHLDGEAGANGWLADPWLAKPALMLMSIWLGAGGYGMILYLAALQTIDPTLYEAAEMDGAGRWQTFRAVTWPLLKPTTFFIFVTSVIAGFQGGFEFAYIMTEGGPAGQGMSWTPWAGETVQETTTLSYYIYTNAYQHLKMGYASAMAWFLFLLVFGVTLINWIYGGRKLNG